MSKDCCPICKSEKKNNYLCKSCQEEQLSKMQTIKIEVPMELYLKYSKIISCQEMGENRAKGVITRGSELYVITGAVGGGNQEHWSSLHAHKVIPAELHNGPTYKYEQLTQVNGSGGYFHSNNQLFACRGKEYVVIPYIEVIFYPKGDAVPIQNTLL